MSKINRAKFLRRSALLTLGSPLLLQGCRDSKVEAPSAQVSQLSKPIKWRMVTTWPPRFPVVGEGCQLFAQWVKEMSDGQLEIVVYGAGELVPAMEVFDVVQNGTAEIGSGAAYYWAGKVPAAQFFGSVPFGMNPQQMNTWLLSGGGLSLWEEVYAPFGLLPFPAGNTGIQMGGWFRKEINRIEDLKGLKMRIPGLGGKVLERAGGTAVLSAGSEIYTNLERGVIDATEWIGPYHDYKMGFHDIAGYYYYPGWHEPGSTLEIMVNLEAFNGLPSSLQTIVRSAALRLHNWVLAEFEHQNALFLKKIVEESNVQLRRFPQEVLDHLRQLTREALDAMIADDPVSKKVHDAYFEYLNQLKDWSAISEQEFYLLMNS